MKRHAPLFILPFLSVLPLSACGDDGHDVDETAAFEEAFAQTELGKSDEGGCSGVVVPDRSGFARRVALTFDDGPNPATTPAVLDILKEHGIRATFFINGSRVRGETERTILARILAEGHILANHSQGHLDLKRVSADKLASEVDKTHAAILEAGGEPEFFRFPFGSASCAAMRHVEDKGYIVTGWHIDSADWCFAKGQGGYCSPATFRYVPDAYRRDLEGYTMSQVRAKNGGIVLFHDIHANTVEVLPRLIATLEDEGYTFVGVDDEATFPRLNGVPPPPQLFVGDACGEDAECNFASASAAAMCHRFSPEGADFETGMCTLPCEGTCPDMAGKSPTFCVSLDGGATGRCVAKAHEVNAECAAILGTTATMADRFIGQSSARPATALVCMPQ